MTGGVPRWMLRLAVVAMLVLLPTQAAAGEAGVVIRSMLLPGSGQAQQGNYKKAAIFAGAFVGSAFGLIVSQVYYNQAVDNYRLNRDTYLSFPDRLMGGEIISINEINQTYADMNSHFDVATDREQVRDFFVVALVTVYVVNIVDVLISPPHDPETARNIQIEASPEGVFLTKSFRF